ncbi:methylthioribose transporter-like [Macrobrachium rosenbergii]|uniref:methylthioribose transporter-like n=1 Tax=Macrobrachium rosenbergii TaxID=79674 RepID=UPI0034D5A170
MSGVVGVGGYVYVGVGAAEWAGPSVVLSVLLATVSAILTGAVCAELCICMPRGGGVYTHVYATLGELPAVLVTSTLLLDFTLLSAIAARSSSQYLSVATNYSLSEALLPHLYESPYLASYCDLPAAGLALLSTVMVAMGTKLVCQVGGVGVGMSLLVLTAAHGAALTTADPGHWTKPPGFFPQGLHGVVCGGAVLSLGLSGIHIATLLAGECKRYRGVSGCLGVGIGVLALLTLFPSAVVATLSSSDLSTIAPLTHLFPGDSLAGMRALVSVGGMVGLWAACLGGVVGGSRLLQRLACDGLAPRCFGKTSHVTTSPWRAALFCGIVATLTAALSSSAQLLKAAGAGTVTAGLAGAAAVLAHRYRPRHSSASSHTDSPTTNLPRSVSLPELTELATPTRHAPHSYEGSRSSGSNIDIQPVAHCSYASHDDIQSVGYDDNEPRQLAVEWAGGTWITAVIEPPQPPTWASWKTSRFLLTTFIINCLAGVGVVRGAKELGVGEWAWAGVALCLCGCVVCGVGLWLQPRYSPPAPTQQEGVPLLPLLAILANILLLLHLPQAALTTACCVWGVTAGVWMIQGRTSSLEAALIHALLTHSNQESPPDLL